MSSNAYLFSLRSALREANSRLAKAEALAELAFAEMRTGRHGDADGHVAELTALAKEQPGPYLDALVNYIQGVFDFYAGRTTASVTHLLHARRGARLAQSEKLEARTLAVLCTALARMGAHGDAFECGASALELGMRAQDDRAIVTAHISLSNLHNDREDGRAALREIDAAGSAMQRLQDPITRISLSSSRAASLVVNARELMSNPTDESRRLVQQTIDACRAAARAADDSGHLKARVFCWGNLAHLYMAADHPAEALATIDFTIQLCEQENAIDNHASALHAKGSFLTRLGRYEEAITCLERGREFALQADYLGVQSLIEGERATCYERLGRIPEALEAAKAHARCLAMQRSAERASLDSLASIKRDFAEAQRVAAQANERADELDRAREKLVEDTQRFKQISFEDALTGYKNRRYFDFRFPELIDQQRAAAQPLSMAIIDIDHFKQINDRAGHLAGDDVLREVARVLAAHCGMHDEVCRLGGDEFALLMPGVTAEAAYTVCEQARVALPSTPIGKLHQATLSIGVAQCAADETPTAFITRTDGRLFEAKRNGRNGVAK